MTMVIFEPIYGVKESQEREITRVASCRKEDVEGLPVELPAFGVGG